jgi:hypothetical protein
MDNPLIICEVAKLHQRDVLREVALRRLANQAKAARITRPGLKKRFVMASESLLKKRVVRQEQETLSPKEHLVVNTNA